MEDRLGQNHQRQRVFLSELKAVATGLVYPASTMNFTILRFDTIDSTNTEALRQAAAGAPEGLCIIAAEQTAGRGRQGRTWVSEKNSGLYLSVVLRPKIDTRFLSLITLMTAVAVHNTLTEIFRLTPDIKWPNDILVNEKKICGILAETTETSSGLAVIVGIGINLRSSNFPPELYQTATSIEEHASGSPPFEGEVPPGRGGSTAVQYSTRIERSLLNHLDHWYKTLQSENGPCDILEAWQQRSTYFSGKPVRVTVKNGSITGVTNGLEPNGALRVRRGDGSITIIQSGDVQQLRSQNHLRERVDES